MRAELGTNHIDNCLYRNRVPLYWHLRFSEVCVMDKWHPEKASYSCCPSCLSGRCKNAWDSSELKKPRRTCNEQAQLLRPQQCISRFGPQLRMLGRPKQSQISQYWYNKSQKHASSRSPRGPKYLNDPISRPKAYTWNLLWAIWRPTVGEGFNGCG